MPIIEKEVAHVNDIQDGQMKEVPFGDGGAVLLSKVNGQFFATSHKCTHYGAPLIKGVLSSDGHITCPWHGACFNVKNGDIEDAPALDSLFKFEVEVRCDKVFVKADDGALKSGKRKPAVVKPLKKEQPRTVVIVGGGASGSAAAEALREFGFDGKIIIVSRENYLPIDRPKLSKSFGIGDPSTIAIRDSSFYDNLGIEFKLDMVVTRVDPTAKRATLSNSETLSYDQLILAVGGWPRSLPLKGTDLANVFTLRSVHNSNAIAAAINNVPGRPKLVIVGSSFIGMEMAAVASKKADVTVIGAENVPFQRVLGESVGKALKGLHEQNGVNFHLGAEIDCFEPKSQDKNFVGYVVLKSGEKIPADLVVSAVGVAPATEFLKASPGFQLERDGSLRVDKHFQVIGWEGNVYATGDIARFPYHYDSANAEIRIEHWSVAENTGRLVAANIAAGAPIKTFENVPYFWTGQYGKSLRYCGYGGGYDDVVVQGNLNELSFAAFYVRGDAVLAVASLNKDPIVSHAAQLIRLQKMPTATEIRSGKNILDIQI